MQTKTIRQLKQGEAFMRKESASKIYTRGEYVRGKRGVWPRGYTCNDWMDISRSIQLHGDTVVFTDFDY